MVIPSKITKPEMEGYIPKRKQRESSQTSQRQKYGYSVRPGKVILLLIFAC